MNNLKLLLISLGIIILLAGVPHLVSYNSDEPVTTSSSELLNTENINRNRLPNPDNPGVIENSPLVSTWIAVYDYQATKGSMTVQIKLENGKMLGYAIEYQDEYGNAESAKDLVLEFKRKQSSGWEAVYSTEFENESYQIPCIIKLISDSKLELSYDYYGFADTEIWTKIK